MVRDASDIFHEPDFDPDLLKRIFAAADGQVIHFPAKRPDLTPFLALYARKGKWRPGLPVNERTFFRALKTLRADKSRENVLRCQQWGLSLRQLARLLGTSVPTIQLRLRGAGDQ